MRKWVYHSEIINSMSQQHRPKHYYIDIHNRPQRQVININKPKEIIKPIDNEVFINDNKRLSSYPKGN